MEAVQNVSEEVKRASIEAAEVAYQTAKQGNINFWTMPDDDPEVKYWKEIYAKGYIAGAASMKPVEHTKEPENETK